MEKIRKGTRVSGICWFSGKEYTGVFVGTSAPDGATRYHVKVAGGTPPDKSEVACRTITRLRKRRSKKSLGKSSFHERTTASKLDLSSVEKGSPLHKLVEALNWRRSYGGEDPKRSIMHYGQLCNCDDGYLCEHRLQFVVDERLRSDADGL